MDFSIYSGPAAVCKPGKVQVEEATNGVCPKCCPRPTINQEPAKGTKKFCESCGTALNDITFLATKTLSKYMAVDATNEALSAILSASESKEDEHIFVPNVSRPGKPRVFNFYPNECNGILQTHSPSDISLDIQWFIDAYGQEIFKLFELYGKENVSVRFVLVGTWY